MRCLTPEPLPENAPFDRITLTIPALLNSSQILFTLGGSTEKLEVFSEALKTKNKLPVSLLLSAAKQKESPVSLDHRDLLGSLVQTYLSLKLIGWYNLLISAI